MALTKMASAIAVANTLTTLYTVPALGSSKTITAIVIAAELVVVKATSSGVSFRLAGDVV